MPHRPSHFVSTVMLAAVFIVAQPSSARATSSFTPLGYLSPSQKFSSATAISADGSVVVGLANPNFSQAFRWSSGQMTGLGFLPGCIQSDATAVSADGSAIVGTCLSSSGDLQAFRWEDTVSCDLEGAGNPCMVGLGFLASASFNISTGAGISADGAVVVGQAAASNAMLGFRWEDTEDCDLAAVGNPCMVGLEDLNDPAEESDATSISADGSTILGTGSGSTLTGTLAVRWDESLAISTLGVQPSNQSYAAFAASADGSVLVGRAPSEGGIEAFRWEAIGGCDPDGAENDCLERLGDLDGGTLDSVGLGVSADGFIVVGTAHLDSDPTGDGRAFIWDPIDGMRGIDEVLEADGVDLTGWTLVEANAISADGTTVAGTAKDTNGDYQAFVATVTVPEPSPLIALASGVFALARLARRARRC